MATVADYEDAVRRIVRADVPADATDAQAVFDALGGSDSPQVTPEIAAEIADSIVTTDRVRDAIESTGELPSEGEIDAIAAVSDDYGLGDRADRVADDVRDQVVTAERVDAAVSDRVDQASDRPTFREDVAGAVDAAGQDREFVGQSASEVTDQQARDLGAPARSNYERAAAQTVAQADSVTPSDVVDGTEAKTPAQVIRSESGEAVAVTGGPGGEVSRQVAEQMGAEYMSASEVTGEMRTAGSGGSTVDLTLRGRKVGEVDL